MRFCDLMALPFENSGRVDASPLHSLDLPVPDDVLEQFVHDHGRNSGFHRQYKHIDLSVIQWLLMELPARDLIEASIFAGFRPWLESVAARLGEYPVRSWSCTDIRPEVVEQWRLFVLVACPARVRS